MRPRVLAATLCGALLILLVALHVWSTIQLRAGDSQREQNDFASMSAIESRLIDQHCMAARQGLYALLSRIRSRDGRRPSPHSRSDANDLPLTLDHETGEKFLQDSGAVAVFLSDRNGKVLSQITDRTPDLPSATEVSLELDSIPWTANGEFALTEKNGELFVAVSLFGPLANEGRIVAVFRLSQWLKTKSLGSEIGVMDPSVQIQDSRGNLFSANPKDHSGVGLDTLKNLDMQQSEGASALVTTPGGETVLIGFAHADFPNWFVILSQRAASSAHVWQLASISTNRLLAVPFLVMAVVLVLLAARPSYETMPQDPPRFREDESLPPGRQAYPPMDPRDPYGIRRPMSLAAPPSSPGGPPAVPKPPSEPPRDRDRAPALELSPRERPHSRFEKRGIWKSAAVSVMGSSHRASKMPCQDSACFTILDGKLLLGAVADGAGSAPLGDQGSMIAARQAVDYLAKCAGSLSRKSSDDQWNRVLRAAVDLARVHVETSAALKDTSPRHLATTLIVFAAMPELIVAAQIGDGAIAVRDRNGIHALTRPQRGEYANVTTFIVSPDAMKSLQQIVWRSPYSEIAALTDGLQLLALNMPSADPHQGFFTPLFDLLAGEHGDGHETIATLEEFLKSDKILSKTDDDLTLLLARIEP